MQSSTPFEIRHADVAAHEAIQLLVQGVVDEIYGGLWIEPPVPIGQTDWSPAWVALTQGALVAVALTENNRVEDLWVQPEHRGLGIASALLSRCELEISERGHTEAALRVVSSNIRALRFYQSHGWTIHSVSPHESLPVNMTNMTKALR